MHEYSYDYGHIHKCPRCGWEDMEDVIRCENCGKWVSEEEAEEGFCPDCAGKTLRVFREMLQSAFTDEQIFFLSQVDCF